MHEVDRRIELGGDVDGARRAGRLAHGRPRPCVAPWPGLAGGELRRDARVEERPVLAVDLQQDADRSRPREQLAQACLVDAEVVDQEALAARHAQGCDGGEIGDRVGLLCGDDRGQPDVDGRVVARPVQPLPDAGQQRPPDAVADAGTRVVEREHRGRATERRGHGVLEEAIGLGIGRDPGMGMDIDDARQHQQPGRIDDAAGAASPGWTARPLRCARRVPPHPPGANRRRGPRCRPGRAGRTGGSPRCSCAAQGISSMRSSWAPSQRQRRPSSRSWSRPVVSVAK